MCTSQILLGFPGAGEYCGFRIFGFPPQLAAANERLTMFCPRPRAPVARLPGTFSVPVATFTRGGGTAGQMARVHIAVVTAIRYSPRSDLQIITERHVSRDASRFRFSPPELTRLWAIFLRARQRCVEETSRSSSSCL